MVPGYTGSRELGRGASGRVVLAVSDATGAPVAVRYLSEELRSDAGFAEDFPGEARALGRLDSPYVVRVTDYVATEDGAALVTELVPGVGLDAVLRRAEDGLGEQAALVVLRDALLGLAEGHRAGVTHRCLRPTNVLVTADGAVRLTDFGLAPRDRGAPVDERAAGYRSPEQWGGEPASPAGDVYALTVVFYECLTGRRPFPGDDPAELSVQHIITPVPEEEVPAAVRELVAAGLAKDPAQRPGDAARFAARVAAVAEEAFGPEWEEQGRRRLATLTALLREEFPPTLAQVPAGPVVPVASEDGRGDARGGGRLRRGWLAGAAALLVVAGTAAVTALGGDEESRPARASQEPAARTPTAPAAPSDPDGVVAEDGVPGPSSSPGGQAAEVSDHASPSASDARGQAGGAGHADRSATAGRGPTASGEASTSAEARVTSHIRELRSSGLSKATAAIVVTTGSTEPVTVTVTWHRSGDAGELGAQDGDGETFELSGDTRYELTADHRFRGLSCYWAVRVSASPGSSASSESPAGEATVEQIKAPLCGLS